jgi:GNAT superfamily N-acetyltransferase
MIVDPVHPAPPPPRRLWTVTVEEVAYGHPAAVALRAAMDEESRLRYADLLPGPAAGTIVYTGLAVTPERRPVGHVALRRAGFGADIELNCVYVAPRYRRGGIGMALLAAVEATARALGAHRIVLRTGCRRHDAERLCERAGYTPIPILPVRADPACTRRFAKEVGRA